jgi:hypothetical protein
MLQALPRRLGSAVIAFERNERSPIMRPDIVPGGIFPNYELPDHTGTVRKLSELQGDSSTRIVMA